MGAFNTGVGIPGCPIWKHCDQLNETCDETICAYAEHLLAWGYNCEECDHVNIDCEGALDLEIPGECPMSTDDYKLEEALTKIFIGKTPQELHEWSGIHIEQCINFFNVVLTNFMKK